MDKETLLATIATLSAEVRSIADEFSDTSKDVNEVRSRLDQKKEELRKAKQELAQMDAPVTQTAETRSHLQDEFRKLAAGEIRSITIGSTGKILQVTQLKDKVAEKDDILDQAQYFYGPNAATNIPVLMPLADIEGYAEGATDVAVDTDAEVVTTQLAPKCHAVVLPITAEMLTMSGIDFEARLNEIFNKSMRRVMHKEMIVGTAANAMTGIFTTATGAGVTTCGSVASGATAIKISDLVDLALEVSGMDEEYEIILNPKVYQGALADSTAGEDVKLYKEGLIRAKEIEGVKVRLDKKANKTFGASKVLAVAAPLGRYAIAIADEIRITAIKVKGDTNTYYQAEYFFNGKQCSASDLACIKSAS